MNKENLKKGIQAYKFSAKHAQYANVSKITHTMIENFIIECIEALK